MKNTILRDHPMPDGPNIYLMHIKEGVDAFLAQVSHYPLELTKDNIVNKKLVQLEKNLKENENYFSKIFNLHAENCACL